VDLRGDLKAFEPVFVFQLLNLALATGKLRIKGSDTIASIYFDRGNIRFAEISARPVKLGEYLVREGYVSAEMLKDALTKQTRRTKLGKILVRDKILDESVLKQAITEQIKEVVFEVVKWNQGTFTFHKDKQPKSEDIFIDIPLDRLMLEGLTRWDESGGDSSK
jgi:hypothetical protein